MNQTAATTATGYSVPTQEAEPQTPAISQPLILGTRQVALVAFVIVSLLALVATISYAAGRIAEPTDAVSPVVQTQRAKTVPAPALPAQASMALAPVVPQAVASMGTPSAAPALGSLFLQVAAVQRGMAEVSVEFLARKGFAARMAPSEQEDIFRVLVGPLTDGVEAARIKEQLESVGFQPFTRRY